MGSISIFLYWSSCGNRADGAQVLPSSAGFFGVFLPVALSLRSIKMFFLAGIITGIAVAMVLAGMIVGASWVER